MEKTPLIYIGGNAESVSAGGPYISRSTGTFTMKTQIAEFKKLMWWTTLTGQTRKLVIQDIQEYGVEDAVKRWRNQHLSMPYGIQALIDATDSLTSAGPLGIPGVGW